jgi:RNA recognition motif-containing protein
LKSGKSKHYAFVEFASKEVADIVAETMNGYFLYLCCSQLLSISLALTVLMMLLDLAILENDSSA